MCIGYCGGGIVFIDSDLLSFKKVDVGQKMSFLNGL